MYTCIKRNGNFNVYHNKVLIGVINKCVDAGIFFYQAVFLIDRNYITSSLFPTPDEGRDYLIAKHKEL